MKRLAILQIDGLSYPALQKAVAGGYMPFLSGLLKSGVWQAKEIHCGIPSTTPASQLRLFYGLENNLPGFRFVMRQKNQMFTPLDAGSIGIVEKECRQKAKPLLSGGAAILSIFNGGAETAISAYSLRLDPRIKREIIFFAFTPWRLLVILYRILLLILIEHSEHRRNQHRHHRFKLRLKNIFQRIIYEVVSGELIYTYVKKKLRQGTSVLYTDFGGYDHLAHHYGPKSKFGFYYLTVCDLYLKKIMTDPAIGRFGYEFIILSDHGQTDAMTFAGNNGENLHEFIGEKYPSRRILNETNPKSLGRIKDDTLYCLNSGGFCLIYDTNGPDPKNQPELENKMPGFINFVANLHGVGAVVYRNGKGQISITNKNGEYPLSSPKAVSEILPLTPPDEKMAAYPYLISVMESAYRPDALIIADHYKSGLYFNFEEMFGTHGGLGGDQTKAFVMCRGKILDGVSSLSSCYQALIRLREA